MAEFDPNHLTWLGFAAAIAWRALPWFGAELREWRLLFAEVIRAKYGIAERGQS